MYNDIMTFLVLMAASMKMTAFWDIAPCEDRRFRGSYCLYRQSFVNNGDVDYAEGVKLCL
jgi:hypothetical protein